MWITIAFIISFILIKFFLDREKQNKSIKSEGGMKVKYSVLLSFILKNFDAKFYSIDRDTIILQIPNIDSLTNIFIIQAFGKVVIQWKFESKLFGSHFLEWDFADHMDQKEMYLKIKNETNRYFESVFESLAPKPLVSRAEVMNYKVIASSGKYILEIASAMRDLPAFDKEGDALIGEDGNQLLKNVVILKAIPSHNMSAIRAAFGSQETVEIDKINMSCFSISQVIRHNTVCPNPGDLLEVNIESKNEGQLYVSGFLPIKKYRENRVKPASIPSELLSLDSFEVFLNQIEEIKNEDSSTIDKNNLEMIYMFFIPDKISALKYTINSVYFKNETSNPFAKHFDLVTPTLKILADSKSQLSTDFPTWFYWSYPDVAYWAITAAGKEIIRSELNDDLHYLQNISEVDRIDHFIDTVLYENYGIRENTIRNPELRRIIDLYKVSVTDTLECEPG